MNKSVISVVLFYIFVAVLPASGGEPDSLFNAGNDYYKNKDYGRALECYLLLIEQDHYSAPLYFNIGNCYFKTGQLGYSILYFLKAQRLAPDDDEINTNLAFTRQFMPAQLEGVRINPVNDILDVIVKPFTLNKMAWISALIFVIFILFLAALIHFRLAGTIYRTIIYFLIILIIFSAGLTTYKYRTDFITVKGVIVSNEADIYSAPDSGSDIEFTGGFGLVMEIEKEADDYYLVLFENKRKGWIRKAHVGII